MQLNAASLRYLRAQSSKKAKLHEHWRGITRATSIVLYVWSGQHRRKRKQIKEKLTTTAPRAVIIQLNFQFIFARTLWPKNRKVSYPYVGCRCTMYMYMRFCNVASLLWSDSGRILKIGIGVPHENRLGKNNFACNMHMRGELFDWARSRFFYTDIGQQHSTERSWMRIFLVLELDVLLFLFVKSSKMSVRWR